MKNIQKKAVILEMSIFRNLGKFGNNLSAREKSFKDSFSISNI